MILEAVPVPLSPADQTVMNRMPVDYAEALFSLSVAIGVTTVLAGACFGELVDTRSPSPEPTAS
ncbi:hypothetical protein ACFU8W_49130 [Streptomyces sp. NPDC057565]|uniref:hypothetical protein n=1 Tax=Streptomyces sp. NPDC057565 TaxID=3346169 RepID=UPI0036C30629